MKINQSKVNWIIDAVLFAGFILAYFLDLTGLALHQWLGIALGALAGYHLLAHWSWVEAVTRRLFGRTSGQSRLYYVIDAALLSGFYLILLTGLAISTWLALPLHNYLVWKNIHVAVSIGTLLLVCMKIGFHWRWVANIAKRHIFVSPLPSKGVAAQRRSLAPASAGRRDFLKLMGFVGMATMVATGSALDGLDWPSGQESGTNAAVAKGQKHASALASSAIPQEISSPTPTADSVLIQPTVEAVAPSDTPQATIVPEPTSNSCVVRCSNHCSYPGRCRRYTDGNQNGLCDFGECL